MGVSIPYSRPLSGALENKVTFMGKNLSEKDSYSFMENNNIHRTSPLLLHFKEIDTAQLFVETEQTYMERI